VQCDVFCILFQAMLVIRDVVYYKKTVLGKKWSCIVVITLASLFLGCVFTADDF